MKISFRAALAALSVSEGGYVNDKRDPGGATNRGVTQRVYDAFRRTRGLPVRSVRFLTEDEYEAIYRVQYWDAVRADELPAGVDYTVFDEAANAGPVRSIRDLQTVLKVTVDGHLGEVTLMAARAYGNVALINALCDRRLSWMHRLKTWRWFGRGWTRRVEDVRKTAKKIAAAAPVYASGGVIAGHPLGLMGEKPIPPATVTRTGL